MKIIGQKEFDEIMKEQKTVLIDFFATWCGPCRMLTPVLEQINDEAKGKYEIYKVDVDESYDLAKRFGIMSVPTMIIFKDGEEVDKIVGLRDKRDIVNTISEWL